MGTRDASLNVAQEVLQAHPDLAGFFCINDPSALGARAALEIANKTDQVTLVGFDGQPEGKLAIRHGKIFADPIQFPDRYRNIEGSALRVGHIAEIGSCRRLALVVSMVFRKLALIVAPHVGPTLAVSIPRNTQHNGDQPQSGHGDCSPS